MRVANRALKTAIAQYEGLSGIDDVYTLRDAGRRFGVARNTVVRWSESGLFVAKSFLFNGKVCRYYTREQCDVFEKSDFYKSLPVGSAKTYAKISSTVHDFDIGVDEVFTPAEFAERLGISVQMLNRFDRNGTLIAERVVRNNRTYRYYTLAQYADFVVSDKYLGLNVVKNSDLFDMRIGKLKVVSYSQAAVQKGYYGSYICECDCGNVVELPRSLLLSGKARSCGCKFHDLTGKDFGWWHVDGPASCTVTTNGQRVFRYYCTCVCGSKHVVFASSLRSGASQSCGCRTEPIGESHVRAYLNSLGLLPLIDDVGDGYIQHKTYPGLIGCGGSLLSYDFYVRKNGCEWLIEYQGQQHYWAVDYFGGADKFEVQVEHDARKRTYAEAIGLRLVEISYKYATFADIVSVLKSAGIV